MVPAMIYASTIWLETSSDGRSEECFCAALAVNVMMGSYFEIFVMSSRWGKYARNAIYHLASELLFMFQIQLQCLSALSVS